MDSISHSAAASTIESIQSPYTEFESFGNTANLNILHGIKGEVTLWKIESYNPRLLGKIFKYIQGKIR